MFFTIFLVCITFSFKKESLGVLFPLSKEKYMELYMEFF